MDAVTGADRVIGWGFAISVAALFGLLVLSVLWVVGARRSRRAHASMDSSSSALRARWGWLLDGPAPGREPVVDALVGPARHRAGWRTPPWVRLLWAHGRAPVPSGVGPPPPLAVTEGPTVSAWSTRDQNVVPSLLNPAVGAARVARKDRWEELDVIADVLGGQMRAAANTEDTGLIEPVRARVVSS